jgi:hypothetical protein
MLKWFLVIATIEIIMQGIVLCIHSKVAQYHLVGWSGFFVASVITLLVCLFKSHNSGKLK